MSYLYTVNKLLNWVDIKKLDWRMLSENKNAIHLLKANQDKIDWRWLSKNENAIHILEANPDKIDWRRLSLNENIFEINYEYYENRCNRYKEDFIKIAFHPKRVIRHLERYNYDLNQDEYFD